MVDGLRAVFSSFDTVKFIQNVQTRNCLWNQNMKDFWKRQKAWEAVAASMFEDYKSYPNNKKRETVLILQKKWKHLRDYFIRFRNKERKGVKSANSRTKRRSPYLNMLHFLDPSVSSKSKPAPQALTEEKNGDTETDDIIDSFIAKNNKKCQPDCHEEPKPEKNQKDENVDLHSVVSTNDSVDISSDCTCSKADNAGHQDQQKADCYQQDDAHLLFFRSLLPDMQSMTERQVFEFKFEVMKLIKHIKYDDDCCPSPVMNKTRERIYACDGDNAILSAPLSELRQGTNGLDVPWARPNVLKTESKIHPDPEPTLSDMESDDSDDIDLITIKTELN